MKVAAIAKGRKPESALCNLCYTTPHDLISSPGMRLHPNVPEDGQQRAEGQILKVAAHLTSVQEHRCCNVTYL